MKINSFVTSGEKKIRKKGLLDSHTAVLQYIQIPPTVMLSEVYWYVVNA